MQIKPELQCKYLKYLMEVFCRRHVPCLFITVPQIFVLCGSRRSCRLKTCNPPNPLCTTLNFHVWLWETTRHIEICQIVRHDRQKSSRSDDVFGILVRKSSKNLLSTSDRKQFSLFQSVKQCL